MTLRELKDHFLGFPSETVFDYALSEPFSWRGSYDEVAFSIEKKQSTRESNLLKINKAYTETFVGYKGGEFTYSDHTQVNFEEGGYRDYSSGEYVAELIAEIEGTKKYSSQEQKLVEIAFKAS